MGRKIYLKSNGSTAKVQTIRVTEGRNRLQDLNGAKRVSSIFRLLKKNINHSKNKEKLIQLKKASWRLIEKVVYEYAKKVKHI